jgi:tRNA dimethylallyltransferase
MTASGKSQIAFEVAKERGDTALLSVDSMAVYREMDIATAKAPRWQREVVDHYLIDLLDPHEEATVSWFQEQAWTALDAITLRGQHAVLVGGTGLYHRAVLDRLDIPKQYPSIRQDLETQAETDLPGLYERLVMLDGLAASRMESSNARRIVRALEVCLGSGRPFSSFGPGLEAYPPNDIVQLGIERPIEEIDESISSRVASWMDEGFADEIDALLARPQGLSRTAAQAIGYEPFMAWRRGECSMGEATEATIVATKQFARRQRSWFRRDPRIRWCDSKEELRDSLRSILSGS